LAQAKTESINYARAEAALKRALLRLKVGEKER
jgi:F0F1-type ATP synthase epsilon subunit